jgi:hypothetical protein
MTKFQEPPEAGCFLLFDNFSSKRGISHPAPPFFQVIHYFSIALAFQIFFCVKFFPPTKQPKKKKNKHWVPPAEGGELPRSRLVFELFLAMLLGVKERARFGLRK